MGYALGSAEYKAMLLLLMVVVLCVFEIFLFFVVCFWRQRGLVSFDFFFFFFQYKEQETGMTAILPSFLCFFP